MKTRLLLWVSVAAVLATSAIAQQHTLARLSREDRADIGHADFPTRGRSIGAGVPLHDSTTSRAAGNVLFANGERQRAHTLSERALRRDSQDAEALFVRMELAGMDGDTATALDAAVRLCEAGASTPGDARVRLAAARLRQAGSNTPEFRALVPQIEALLRNSRESWDDLQLALLRAAMDGAPGLDPYALSRASGILTDWRIVGPIGSHPLLDVSSSISASDDLAEDVYAGRAVENFQFPDGWVRLPEYLSRRGSFYAAAKFASLTSETRKVRVESAGSFELFVDGNEVVRGGAGGGRDTAIFEASFEAAPGPHRVLLRFAPSAAPLRVSVVRDGDAGRLPLRAGLSAQEAAYLLAAEQYAGGDFTGAIKQIDAVATDRSSALQFLRAQAAAMLARGSSGATAPGQQFSPELAAITGVADGAVWATRVAEHPSCSTIQAALAYYESHGMDAQTPEMQQRLEGCAPESLAYAQSLAHDGRHKEAAQALRKGLAAAPLNRAARLMLVRELQLAGDDGAAQQAAVDWLRIAPNAPSYHRLAASAELGDGQQPAATDFFLPYRRDAAALARGANAAGVPPNGILLLDDRVAIERADGSVSLYVHLARAVSPAEAERVAIAAIPRGAQVLTLRVVHIDGAITPIELTRRTQFSIRSGDMVDEEYVIHFTGDGGIPEHAEAFQFTFGSFNDKVLNARFVVLTPTDRGDGGVVIATGAAPAMAATIRNGMLERVWEKTARGSSRAAVSGMAIVRVVEQDNGWSVPSDAEHRRRIETIHPGPRPEDS